MPDIKAELIKFKNANYGEDVRDAMISAMNTMNNTLETEYPKFVDNAVKAAASEAAAKASEDKAKLFMESAVTTTATNGALVYHGEATMEDAIAIATTWASTTNPGSLSGRCITITDDIGGANTTYIRNLVHGTYPVAYRAGTVLEYIYDAGEWYFIALNPENSRNYICGDEEDVSMGDENEEHVGSKSYDIIFGSGDSQKIKCIKTNVPGIGDCLRCVYDAQLSKYDDGIAMNELDDEIMLCDTAIYDEAYDEGYMLRNVVTFQACDATLSYVNLYVESITYLGDGTTSHEPDIFQYEHTIFKTIKLPALPVIAICPTYVTTITINPNAEGMWPIVSEIVFYIPMSSIASTDYANFKLRVSRETIKGQKTTNTLNYINNITFSQYDDENTFKYKVSALSNNVKAMKQSFQAGVDSVYNAIVAQGTTPASKSLSDVTAGVGTLSTNRYDAGYKSLFNKITNTNTYKVYSKLGNGGESPFNPFANTYSTGMYILTISVTPDQSGVESSFLGTSSSSDFKLSTYKNTSNPNASVTGTNRLLNSNTLVRLGRVRDGYFTITPCNLESTEGDDYVEPIFTSYSLVFIPMSDV